MSSSTTLRELRQNLKPKPLKLEELQALFVETSDARDQGLSMRRRIEMILDGEETHAKVLFAGHGGAGKSTELVKFRSENEGRYVFVPLSISKDGNPNEVSIESLLVLIVEAVLRTLRDEGIPFDDQSIENIYDWFDEVFEISKQSSELQAEVGAGVDSKDSPLGLLLGFMAKLKVGIRTGTSNVSTRIRRKEGQLPQLVTHCRQLLLAADQAAFEHSAGYLVLIVEDLDKISLEHADELFIQNPAVLADLPIRAIFTAPIFLHHSPKVARLGGYFQSVTMPMIKITNQEGGPEERGIRVIRKILAQRIHDLDQTLEPAAVKLAIEKTGGVLRHLFDALTTATMTAEYTKAADSDGLPITEAHVRYGLDDLKKGLLNRISAAFLSEEFGDITTDQLFERLYDFRDAKRAESDPINLVLLQAHALIEYNGEGWHRVHPLVDEYLDERKRNGKSSD